MADGRDTKGRFAPGSSGGPGRPRRTVEAQYLEVVIGNVSITDWERIVKRAVADAIIGDFRARDWLSQYLLPSQRALESGVLMAQPVEWDLSALSDEQLIQLRELQALCKLRNG